MKGLSPLQRLFPPVPAPWESSLLLHSEHGVCAGYDMGFLTHSQALKTSHISLVGDKMKPWGSVTWLGHKASWSTGWSQHSSLNLGQSGLLCQMLIEVGGPWLQTTGLCEQGRKAIKGELSVVREGKGHREQEDHLFLVLKKKTGFICLKGKTASGCQVQVEQQEVGKWGALKSGRLWLGGIKKWTGADSWICLITLQLQTFVKKVLIQIMIISKQICRRGRNLFI